MYSKLLGRESEKLSRFPLRNDANAFNVLESLDVLNNSYNKVTADM